MLSNLRWGLLLLWVTITALIVERTPKSVTLPATYIDAPKSASLTRLIFRSTSRQSADTTAVILNWSRFPNVIRIASLLCTLEDTVATVHVWNNSPNKISKQDFPECPAERLKITNSPSNLYFQARFLACAEASTPFCFIQDDDYLILPEIIQALRLRFSEDSTSAIYLLPPHEALSSHMKRIRVDSRIHTSFAWLGHGAMLKRSQAQDFLALLQYLNVSDEEMKMADNYYAILANVYPEVWFDQGIGLDGGIAFTEETEGDERNNRHITQAARYLDEILNCTQQSCVGRNIPFVSFENHVLPSVHRAPCVGTPCLLETTIPLLPSTQTEVDSAANMLKNEKYNRNSLKETDTSNYLLHPPSHAVDGNLETGFCVSQAKKGNVIRINFPHALSDEKEVEIAFVVDRGARSMLLAGASLQFLVGEEWVYSNAAFSCASIGLDLHECSSSLRPFLSNISAFQLLFQRDVEHRGCIQEMWARERISVVPVS